jgi:hypothetical protein
MMERSYVEKMMHHKMQIKQYETHQKMMNGQVKASFL